MNQELSMERTGKRRRSRRLLAGAGALVLLLWLVMPGQTAWAGSSAGTAMIVQGGLSSALVGVPATAGRVKVHVSQRPDARSPSKPPVWVSGPPPWAPGKPEWAPGPPLWAGKGKTQASAVATRGAPKKGK
jgi:hypothetical protein